ncbi:MAG: mechanosensitive ion channel domain-containing protein [Alphaproteobacteria bacterium]
MTLEFDYVNQVMTNLFEAIGLALPGIMAGLVVIVVFLVAAAVVRRVFRRLAENMDTEKRPLVGLAAQTARYAIITMGLITGLGTMGLDVSVLIAGLGLSGFALSFAFRDALSNLLAGVLIILYQPFKPGDTITVSGKTGTVEAVNFRYAVLTSEGKTVLVPNSSIFGTIIVVEHGQ